MGVTIKDTHGYEHHKFMIERYTDAINSGTLGEYDLAGYKDRVKELELQLRLYESMVWEKPKDG